MRLKCTQMEVCILTPPATNQILKGYSSKNDENTRLQTPQTNRLLLGRPYGLKEDLMTLSHNVNDEACPVS